MSNFQLKTKTQIVWSPPCDYLATRLCQLFGNVGIKNPLVWAASKTVVGNMFSLLRVFLPQLPSVWVRWSDKRTHVAAKNVTCSFRPASNLKSHWGPSNIRGGTGCKTPRLCQPMIWLQKPERLRQNTSMVSKTCLWVMPCHALSKSGISINMPLTSDLLFCFWIAKTSFDSLHVNL